MVHHQCGFRSTSLDSLRDSYIPYSIYDRVGNGFIVVFFFTFFIEIYLIYSVVFVSGKLFTYIRIFFQILFLYKVKVKVAHWCLTLWDPKDYIRSWNSPGQNNGVGSLSLLQGIFLHSCIKSFKTLNRQIFYGKHHSEYSIVKCI